MAGPSATTTSFTNLADEVLQSYYEANPVSARRLGLHAYDGRLPDISPGGLKRRAIELDGAIARLERVDSAALDETRSIEREVLLSRSRFELFRIREWRSWSRYPLDYLDLMDVSDYMLRDYAPRIDRAMALCMHLEGIPRLLDAAVGLLDEPLDRTVIDTTCRLLRSYAEFVEGELGDVVADAHEGDEAVRRNLLQARRHAAEATHGFVAELETRAPAAQRDAFAIGPDIFAKMLLHGEGVDVPVDRLLEIAEAELARNRAELVEVAAEIDPKSSPQEVMKRAKRDHPAAGEVVEVTRGIAEQVSRFVIEKNLVTIPSKTECRIERTPSYLAWAFAMLDGPGTFETEDFPCYYYVTPPRADWDEAQTEDWLQEFSHGGLRNTTVHEAWPGHFVHDLHLRQVPSRVLRTHFTYSSFEAWAHYCEKMMIEQGYADGDGAVHLAQIGDALLRSVRFVVAIRMHTRGMSVTEAADLFRREALLGDEAARAEAERGTFDPGYVNYTLGKLMLLKLREDWRAARGEEASLKEFHDEFLRWGAAPVPFVRRRMIPGDTGPIL